jgi:Fungal Zn(2)-Cys(6) binuclear cluster domain
VTLIDTEEILISGWCFGALHEASSCRFLISTSPPRHNLPFICCVAFFSRVRHRPSSSSSSQPARNDRPVAFLNTLARNDDAFPQLLIRCPLGRSVLELRAYSARRPVPGGRDRTWRRHHRRNCGMRSLRRGHCGDSRTRTARQQSGRLARSVDGRWASDHLIKRNSANNLRVQKIRCIGTGEPPCQNCQDAGVECVYVEGKKRGPAKGYFEVIAGR